MIRDGPETDWTSLRHFEVYRSGEKTVATASRGKKIALRNMWFLCLDETSTITTTTKSTTTVTSTATTALTTSTKTTATATKPTKHEHKQLATEAFTTTDKPPIMTDQRGGDSANVSNAAPGNLDASGTGSPTGAIVAAVVGVAALVVLVGIFIRRRARPARLPADERNHPAIVQNASFEQPRRGLAVLDAADHEDAGPTIAALTQHGQAAAKYAEPSARQSELYDAGSVPGAADHSTTDADYRVVGRAPPAAAEYAEIDQLANGIDGEYHAVGGNGNGSESKI